MKIIQFFIFLQSVPGLNIESLEKNTIHQLEKIIIHYIIQQFSIQKQIGHKNMMNTLFSMLSTFSLATNINLESHQCISSNIAYYLF